MRLAEWARRAGVISADEHASLSRALGSYDRDEGGRPAGTPVSVKVAVTEFVAILHDLASAEGVTAG